MALIDEVKNCTLFTELYDDEIDRVLKKCNIVKFPEGATVVEEDSTKEAILILVRGDARVKKKVKDREMSLTILKSGALIGQSVLINEKPTAFTIVAQKECDFLVIDKETIFEFFEKDPRTFSILLMNVARSYSKRLRHSKKVIKSIHNRFSSTKS